MEYFVIPNIIQNTKLTVDVIPAKAGMTRKKQEWKDLYFAL